MSPASPGTIDIDNIAELLEKITDLLRVVNIELAPAVSQCVLLFLVLGAVVPLILSFRPQNRSGSKGGQDAKPETGSTERKRLAVAARWLRIAALVPFGAVVVCIVGSWVYAARNPLPKHVAGVVRTNHTGTIRVVLLDERGEEVQTGSGSVDSRTREFLTLYQTSLGSRPRTIRLVASGCTDVERPISRAQLRAEVIVEFECQ